MALGGYRHPSQANEIPTVAAFADNPDSQALRPTELVPTEFWPPGGADKTWTDYSSMPRLRRSGAGLQKPSEHLILASLYQRMSASTVKMSSLMFVESHTPERGTGLGQSRAGEYRLHVPALVHVGHIVDITPDKAQ